MSGLRSFDEFDFIAKYGVSHVQSLIDNGFTEVKISDCGELVDINVRVLVGLLRGIKSCEKFGIDNLLESIEKNPMNTEFDRFVKKMQESNLDCHRFVMLSKFYNENSFK